jgi:uncharacterized protein YndB with AHSA1/START domain
MAEKYSLQTSVVINAPAKKIFDLMLDLNRFDDWNPFMTMDPTTTTKVTQSKPGPGSLYEYEGKRIGRGQQVVLSAEKPNVIVSEMSFFGKKKTNTAIIEFRIQEESAGTLVTWYMEGERGLGGKFMGTVLGFDKMMGKSFASGLESLKTLMESEGK